jgi:hypothetical protein
MSAAYTPGLKVNAATWVRKERRLPLKGEVLVKAGDPVESASIVARTYLPGKVEPLNVANKLGLDPKDLRSHMLLKEGEPVRKDQKVAETKGFFGKFKNSVASPIDGKVDLISDTTGQVMLRAADIPVQVDAWLDGVVESVIPDEGVIIKTYGAFIQGIFGVGGEVTGNLEIAVSDPSTPLETSHLGSQHAGQIVVAGSLVTHAVIAHAVKLGVKGIIAGGIDDADLRAWLGYDLGVAITGSEELGLTLVVTEGFGKIRMAQKTWELLNACRGLKTSMSGATQIRAGVIRPEIVIARPREQWPGAERAEDIATLGMNVGAPVRVIREPDFGALAHITSLPVDLAVVPTEAHVRVVEIELSDGRRVVLPRANVELIES